MAEETNYLNIDGEVSTTPVGYDNLLAKSENLNLSDNVDISAGINSGNSSAILGSSSISFDQTTIGTLNPNQDIQSGNFLSGSTGWKLFGDGNMEGVGLTLTGGILKYGKTSFSDSTNAGYILNSSGIYIGSASDASYLKYTLATGVFFIKASVGWSSITDDDTNKPDNNATVGAIIGTNLLDTAATTPTEDLIVNYKSFTTGEAITAGNVVCIKPSYTDFYANHDSYVDSSAPDDNFGTGTAMYLGQQTRYYRPFLKFSMTSVPSAENILKAELRLTKYSFSGGGASSRNVNLLRVSSADWDELTITHNNKPDSVNDVGTVYGSQVTAAVTSGSTVVIWDVTHMIRQWKEEAVNNYGFQLDLSFVDGETLSFHTDETGNTADKPTLRIYKADTSDGLIYKASNDDYNLCRSVIGFALDTAAISTSCRVQYQSIASSLSIGGDATGGKLFLDTAGGYNIATNNMTRMIQVGKVFSNSQTLVWIEDRDIEIESTLTAITKTSSTRRFYAPIDARYALIYVQGTEIYEPEKIIKSFRCGVSNSFTDSDSYPTASYDIGISWGANYIEIVPNYTLKKLTFYT